jgi:hypothetical protein
MRRRLIGLAVLVLASCGGEQPVPPANPPDEPARDVFIEIAKDVGLDFVHFNGMSGEHYILEHMSAGAALFDYDNDGDLDVYLIQGNMLGPNKDASDATFPPPGPLPLSDQLYRNDLVVHPDGSRSLRFTDVTAESGIHATGYGMGVATGDYDNNGWPDFYVTNWGPNQMWRNNGDGTFTDVTEQAGTADDQWGASAAFVDYDHDGWLDLYVVNYVEFNYQRHALCPNPTGELDYCGPQAYEAQSDRLFRNRGDGTFEDVSDSSGIGVEVSSGLGIVTADLDGNGLIDIYVAIDRMENALWINEGDGTFRNEALMSGCALNREGRPEAGMGVDAADFDGDGDDDLFLAHLGRETNTVYVNDRTGTFEDRSAATRLGPPSFKQTGWGTNWFDYDNDGWLDLIVVNGAIMTIEEQALAGDPYPLRETNRLYRNEGNGRFADVSEQAGEALQIKEVSRGAVFGDIDNDGDTDVLVTNNAAAPSLLLNEIGAARRWLGLRLVGTDAARDMLGSRVEIVLRDGRSVWRRAYSDGSYCSANDPRVLVGLGDAGGVERVRVHWLDGQVEEWTGLEIGRYTTLRQGTGHGLGER